MTIPLTRALYYPTIDILDEAWLKTAMLYWNEILTVVPASIHQPYNTRTSRAFYEAKVLLPYYVEPDEGVTQELKSDLRKYLKSRQAMRLLQRKNYIKPVTIANPSSKGNLFPGDNFFEIHPEKVADSLHDLMRPFLNDGWYRVDENFKNFYMTLLATHVSRTCRAGLLTDRTVNSQLSNAVKLDAQFSHSIVREHLTNDSERTGIKNLAEGALVSLALEGIRINPNTPVEQILKFREKYNSGLGRFRRRIADLSEIISSTESDSFEAYLQSIRDTYLNEISPEVSSLKEELNQSGINGRIGDLLTIVIPVSAAPLLNYLGISPILSLLSTASLSVVAYAMKYNAEKAKILRENSFSYLLRSKKVFYYKSIRGDNAGLQIPRPL